MEINRYYVNIKIPDRGEIIYMVDEINSWPKMKVSH